MLISTFQITSAAADLNLVTIEELRSELRVPTGQDSELIRLQETITADIAAVCNIRTDGFTPATLLRETIVETFRRGIQREWVSQVEIVLARRPVADLEVVEGGVTLVAELDYVLNPASGKLTRLHSFNSASWLAWCGGTIVATYSGGFPSIPADLKGAALELARVRWSEGHRDPLLRQQTVEGIGSRTYWVGGSNSASVPQSVQDRLSRFRNFIVR